MVYYIVKYNAIIATQMDIKIIIPNEVSQTEKYIISLKCRILKKKRNYLLKRNRPPGIENKLMVTKEER